MSGLMILGGGGSFALNTALFFEEVEEFDKIYLVGRQPLRSPAYTLGVENRSRIQYKAIHITYEFDLLCDYIEWAKPDVIINFAAQGEGAVSWDYSWRFFETNSMALARLVEWLNEEYHEKVGKTPRFIQISTSELYGSVDKPVDENAPVKPTSPYAASKLAFDFYLLSMFKVRGIPMNIVRPSNCYGPGQLFHRIIPKTLLFGMTGRKVPLMGGGAAMKSYMHVRDLAAALWIIIRKAQLGQVFNVGPRDPTSIREVVERCAGVLDIKFDDLAKITAAREGEDSMYWLNSNAIRSLGWDGPAISWERGLGEVRDWVAANLTEFKEAGTNYQIRG